MVPTPPPQPAHCLHCAQGGDSSQQCTGRAVPGTQLATPRYLYTLDIYTLDIYTLTEEMCKQSPPLEYLAECTSDQPLWPHFMDFIQIVFNQRSSKLDLQMHLVYLSLKRTEWFLYTYLHTVYWKIESLLYSLTSNRVQATDFFFDHH